VSEQPPITDPFAAVAAPVDADVAELAVDAEDVTEVVAEAIEEAIEVGKQWAHLSGQARIQLNNSYKNKISELKNAQ